MFTSFKGTSLHVTEALPAPKLVRKNQTSVSYVDKKSRTCETLQ